MHSTPRVVVLCLVGSLALMAASASAASKLKPITGKLSKPGYTVIAVAANGKATSVRAKPSFRVVPPAVTVTLQLRAPNGKYAGPVVVGGGGKRVLVGVKAGAKLGRIKVNPRKGYAKVAKRLPSKWVDKKRWARARHGVPIGAGNFGFVRSRPSRGSVPGDLDLDGIPDVLDVDVDGDLILNDLDRSTAAHAAQAATAFQLHSVLPLPPEAVVNADAATLTTNDIDTALSNWGYLIIETVPGAELDCGGSIQQPPRAEGLVYCSTGGTGRVFGAPLTASCPVPNSGRCGPRFPDDFDPDHNGLGTPPQEPYNPPGFFFLSHGAKTAQIGTGDVLIQRVTTDGVQSESPATLQFVFATVPALVSYRDTAGNSAPLRYPVAPGGPGTNTNGFPVAPGPDGDIVLALTFWRPQRKPVAGEPCLLDHPPCDWIDIGGLRYTAIVQARFDASGTPTDIAKGCPLDTFSNTDLQPAPGAQGPNGGGVLTDPAADRPANAANTFTYTLNVSQCLRSLGVAWNSGESLGLTNLGLSANGTGDAEETVVFKHQ